jgi:thiamine-phosphate pyrophosphorylase
MKQLADCRLYAFVDTAYLRGRKPESIAEQLCEGGADIIQFRAKEWPRDQVLAAAEKIVSVTQRHGVPLAINDHLDVAKAVGAALCHLGQEDFFDTGHTHASQLAGAVQIGLSTHAPAQAERAIQANPAYIAIGPVYATPTKPTAAPVTLQYVRWARAHVRIPWFAIGGINNATIDDVLAAGATRVCIVSAILNADDAATACKNFSRRVLQGTDA